MEGRTNIWENGKDNFWLRWHLIAQGYKRETWEAKGSSRVFQDVQEDRTYWAAVLTPCSVWVTKGTEENTVDSG